MRLKYFLKEYDNNLEIDIYDDVKSDDFVFTITNDDGYININAEITGYDGKNQDYSIDYYNYGSARELAPEEKTFELDSVDININDISKQQNKPEYESFVKGLGLENPSSREILDKIYDVKSESDIEDELSENEAIKTYILENLD